MDRINRIQQDLHDRSSQDISLIARRNPVNPVKSCKSCPFLFFIRVCLRLSAVAVISLTTGCAEMRWSKPGADSAKLEEDLAQCRGEARLQATRESLPRMPGSSPALRTDSTGRPAVAQAGSRGTDTLVLEQELTGSCMRGKGYALAPVDTP
jgi:hypothetical protein